MTKTSRKPALRQNAARGRGPISHGSSGNQSPASSGISKLNGKPVLAVLTQTDGVGVIEGTKLCRQYNLLPSTPWGRLSAERKNRLERAIWLVEARVLFKTTSSLKGKADTVKGIRIRRGLPSRGQRTQTNASTAKRLNSNRLL